MAVSHTARVERPANAARPEVTRPDAGEPDHAARGACGAARERVFIAHAQLAATILAPVIPTAVSVFATAE
ncbi:hypothetical protein [Actinomadura harenae]|uniref:Uncharacterized protein n=1 Tax=Actinomadura harenae TaxID=2483351 RepID=A0A3M2MDF8_9ACTN|nr:hypothetical protein [Actinomadura harenae]RMI47569.1 hypothetical protein EBO15_01315 [Actinomadura harenae]